jgi:hypothetical protein
MLEVLEALHSLAGLIHVPRALPGFVRAYPGISAVPIPLTLAGSVAAILIRRTHRESPPSIR